ncbi:substrate-binding domain-containing protein [Okibacterium endophyticum]
MSILKKLSAFGVAVIATGALVLSASLPASANVAGTANGEGSDTTQDVMNAFATQSGGTIGSWDATGAPARLTINGVTFDRPNGSGQGVQALSAASRSPQLVWGNSVVAGTTTPTPLTKNQIAFARSSSGPAAGSGLTYIPFGTDAVTYATDGAIANLQDIPLTAPTGQLSLRAIYTTSSAGASYVHNGTTYTVGVQGSGADIVPFIPQAGSGTRSFWQTQMGGTFGSAVSDTFIAPGGATVDVQEHNGRVTAQVPGAIAPFSIAQWVTQSNAGASGQNGQPGSVAGVTVIDRRWNAALGNVNGVPATIGGNLNPNFPITRSVYNVVDTNDIGKTAQPYQVAINNAFVGSGAGLYTATYGGQSLINLFGFATHPNAGSTTLTGGLTFP